MGRFTLLLLAVALALVVVAPASGDDIEDKKAAVDARIADLRSQIEASKQQEGVLTSQLSSVTFELENAQAAVGSAQSRFDALELELASAQARLGRLNDLLQLQTERVERLQEEYERAVVILEARVRAIYIEEPPDVLSFLVSASSFDELIDNVELIGRIGAQDRLIARQVKRAREDAAAERRATAETRRLQAEAVSVISARASEARTVRDQLVLSRGRLADAMELKQNALESTRQSREEYRHEVESLAAESAELGARIRAAQEVAGSTGTGAPSAAGFVWPVAGAVVSGFGWRWGRMHEGIDIAAALGTPIGASAAGTVIHAGWLGGYGNLVVVDHGNGLATAYAHASSILVGVGQQVAQGQTVALVGSTGRSSGPHLHFEVRVNGTAVDPLGYL